MQAAPPVPHFAVVGDIWQVPFAVQQPLGQFCALHIAAAPPPLEPPVPPAVEPPVPPAVEEPPAEPPPVPLPLTHRPPVPPSVPADWHV